MNTTNKTAHSWDLTPKEAIAVQKCLQKEVILKSLEQEIKLVAGADISHNRFSDRLFSAIVILDYESMEIVETATAEVEALLPYIPGLLSFREVPALLAAWKKLEHRPDITIVDGHGIAHPRRLGIATHFGLATNSPTIGCGKNILTGAVTKKLGVEKGSTAAIKEDDELLGYAVRTKADVNPAYISPGHQVTHDQAVEVALRCARGYKLPAPTRQAHLAANAFRCQETSE